MRYGNPPALPPRNNQAAPHPPAGVGAPANPENGNGGAMARPARPADGNGAAGALPTANDGDGTLPRPANDGGGAAHN